MAYSTVGIFSRAFSFDIGKIPDFSNALGSNLPQSSCPRALARSPGKFFLDTLKVTSLSDELLKTSRHLLLRGPKKPTSRGCSLSVEFGGRHTNFMSWALHRLITSMEMCDLKLSPINNLGPGLFL